MKVATSLAIALTLTLGAPTFAATVTYNQAAKGGYSLFDQPLSSDVPPSSIFASTAGLSSWLPPRFMPSGVLGSKPIPTNNWWGNMIASTTDSAVQAVWTNPYALRPKLDTTPYGLAVNNPFPTRFFSNDKTGNGDAISYYSHIFSNDMVLSATAFDSRPKYEVSSWDDLSVTVAFSDTTSATSKVELTLVPGMAFVTAKYTDLIPMISTTSTITAINGAAVASGGSVTASRFVVSLSNGQKWVLYTTTTFKFTLNGPTTLVGSSIGGTIRAALITSDAQLAVLDSTASCLLEGSDVEAQVSASYMFRLKTSGDCSNGLFHYLQVHHMDTLVASSAAAVANAGVNSATRGPMTGVLTKTSPPVLQFMDSQNVQVDFYPSRKPVASVVAAQKMKATLIADLNASWPMESNGGYYANGKLAHKYANLCLVANDDVVTGSDKAELLGKCLDKLEAVLARFVANSWDSPLQYDTTYRGIISSAGFANKDTNADYGNTVYNDHHYHYGYWIATAAIVNYLDPSWSQITQLNRVTMHLIRDVANPSNSDTNYPKFRQFDWFRGHSYSHGITPAADGKDEESSSEDINFHYAMALFGQATGNSALANVANLMLRVNTRSVQTYFLMANDNRVHPASFIPNKVPGILFDNKAAYTTWFSTDKAAIHGIQMIPITPVTEYVRTATFIKEEWDTILSKHADVVGNSSTNAWMSILYANYATVNPDLALQKLQTVALDDGLSRTWALYMAARLATAVVTPAPTTMTPTPTTVTPSPTTVTPAPTTVTPAPTTVTPAPTTVTPAPTTVTPAPTTVTPAPTTVTPAPTTVTPAPTTVTPAPSTVTPAPTTTSPAVTAPSGGSCGNDKDGPIACPTGEYCQPWNPTWYQCRTMPATCGTQLVAVDFYGDDLAMVEVTMPEQCCDKCRTTTGCVAYTYVNYNADGRAYCYLKKGSGTKKAAVGVVSAIVQVSTTPAPTTATPAPTTVTPAPTTVTPAPTTATLAPTTVAPSGGACGNQWTGATACPTGQYCQPWDPNYYQCRTVPAVCGTQQVNVDFNGDDLATVQVNLPELCCDKCRSTSGCTAYTFVNYNADGKAYCYLKKGTGTKKTSVGAVSAVITTTTTPASTTATPAPTTATPAPKTVTPAPTTVTPAPTTVAPSGGACGNQWTGASACPSGQYCQPWDPNYYQCRTVPASCGTQQVNVDFNGDDLATVQVNLPELCCDKCSNTVGCVAYTFVNYNSDGKAYCYLKKGTGTKKTSVGAVSATISNPKPKCSYSSNTDFYGNDLSSATGLTLEQCCDKCASMSRCSAFTYAYSVCYMKTSSAGSKAASGISSGVIN